MDAYITITLIDDVKKAISKTKDRDFMMTLIRNLLSTLNYNIAFHTTIEYRISPVINYVITYQIKNYTTKQTEKGVNDLAKEKFDVIDNFCSNIDEKYFNNFNMWALRSLEIVMKNYKETNKFSVRNLFEMKAIVNAKTVKQKNIFIKYPEIKYPKYDITTLIDGSTIRQYIDPYVSNYMVCVDYSKDMSELSYHYNCLHVYEHYTTHAWDKLSSINVIDLNGSTYFNGLCYIYTTANNKEDIRDRLISSILFHIKSSDADFVKKTEVLKTETLRTISEAYILRNITRLGRSDQQAFNTGEYSPNLFAYWSSLPQNILVITNEKIEFNVDKINEFYKEHHKTVNQPEITKFDYFPIESYQTHYLTGQHTFKMDKNEIIKNIYSNKYESCFYGLDTKTIAYTNEQEFIHGQTKKLEIDPDMSYQTLLSPLLFFAKYVDKNTIDKYIKTNVFPKEAALYETLNLGFGYKDNFKEDLNQDEY